MNVHRRRVVEVLQLFASKSEQFELFWAEAEKIFVPDVLSARWEKIYWRDGSKFRDGFSIEELQDLDCFYDFLLARLERFPKGGFRVLMTDIYWDSVCRLAEATLERLGRNEKADP